ncbi:hypothetical protein [Saccharibacillus alkalitolerans]|uniref:DUF2029 domain-containing protein n=1 Tax=Saccharibacillus alkalitolerans TaxID=2705290 RepID=A0ABX0FCB4_9BACL|nr:hypothetical protein [Saccharibacillus alkalitolerans]NGZ77938.1 hypothetical protein [Saccharibacillus alkalitolerans]
MKRHDKERPNKASAGRRFAVWLIVLAVAAVLIRLALASRYGGFMSDQELFVDWMRQVRQRGLGTVYIEGSNINYPPLFLLIMEAYRSAAGLFGIVPAAGELSFKGVLIALDLAAFGAAVLLTRSSGRTAGRLFVLALLALNPALIFGSAVWGQVDMLHSLLMAASLLLLPGSPPAAGALFALALLSKFQAVTLLAVFGIYFLRLLLRREFRPPALFAAGFAGVTGACAAFFAWSGGLQAMLKGAYLSAVGMYPQVTMNAMNVWYYFIGTPPTTPDTTKVLGFLSLRTAGFLLLALCVVYAAACLWRSRMDAAALLKSAALVNFAFFMLPTEIHERYSVPALVLAVFVCLYDRRWRLPAVLLSLSVTANLWMVQAERIGVYPGLAVVYVNVALLLWMLLALGREMRAGRSSDTADRNAKGRRKARAPGIG